MTPTVDWAAVELAVRAALAGQPYDQALVSQAQAQDPVRYKLVADAAADDATAAAKEQRQPCSTT